MLMCLPTARASSEPQKEEVIYATLNADGQAKEAYVVNIFPGGAVTDYGNYSSVRMMNTEDSFTHTGDLVSFFSSESRVYYQGNMSRVELPWLFTLDWKLNGQSVTAKKMAGAEGSMEMELSIRQNPTCSGNFFDTHALQITASLDTEQCSGISAEGATQANVGSVRQLNWIILPGTEITIHLSADVTDFEMPALSINGVRMQLDPGDEVIDDVLSLVDGLDELSSHNAELTDGAQQIVRAAFDTANAELKASEADFHMLGITLNPLTMKNYDEEITRLQTELLDKVDEFVLRQAEDQLRAQIRSAAEAMVRAEVEKAARAQVEQEVRKAAGEQVHQAVTAEARMQVEAAVDNPTDEDIDVLVDARMQTAEVQTMIDKIAEAKMASPEVQLQISKELEEIVRPQVEAAVEAEVRSQAEETVRQTVRCGIEKTMEAKIRAEVIAGYSGSDLPALTPEEPDTPDFHEPELPALPTIPAPTQEPSQSAEEPSAPVFPSIGDILDGLKDRIPSTLPSRNSSAKSYLSPVAHSVDLTDTSANAGQLFLLSNTTESEYCLISPEIEAEVARRMESEEVQQQIDAMTDTAMNSETTQAMIDAQADILMKSPAVQAVIKAELAKQVADPDNRAQAEAIARQEVRSQAEAAVREQVRTAILAKLATMTESEKNAMIEEQMRSEAVQQMIENEVAVQMQSAQVQALIDAEVANQMKSDEVKSLMDAECAKRLQSGEVQAQINSQIAAYRSSAAFLDSVAKALEENGENGEAYQALVTLRETLDDVMQFYNGLVEYTDGVEEAATGVGKARTEVAAMLGDGDSDADHDTISFASEKNGAVKSVQFVLTTPAIEKTREAVAEEATAQNDTILDKLLQLFQ